MMPLNNPAHRALQGASLLGWPLTAAPTLHVRSVQGDPSWSAEASREGEIQLVDEAIGMRTVLRWEHLEGFGLKLTGSLSASKSVQLVEMGVTLSLQGNRSEAYVQRSVWAAENQGEWSPIPPSGLIVQHLRGRTSENGTPYLAVRSEGASTGLVFHVVPCGNYQIRAFCETSMLRTAATHLTVLLGEDACASLSPGEVIHLPEVWVQEFVGQPWDAAPNLHRLLRSDWPPVRRAPVVYNTWLDRFQHLDPVRLRAQLRAACEASAEVFVVDAGWFGALEDWWEGVGDWREATDRSFLGKMGEFADEVRSQGLGFGIWMEPERVGPHAPIRALHPEWVKGNSRLDLENPDAWQYIRSEVGRVVDTYGAVWVKLDSNFELGHDPRQKALAGYCERWHALVEDLQASYPDVYWEGCSSGAMRADLSEQSHFDCLMLSDNVNSWEAISIHQGASLRLDPQRIGRWFVLYERGGELMTEMRGGLGSWERVDLDFGMCSAMLGRLALSGDLASLSEARISRIRELLGLYRELEPILLRSVAHLLTPPMPLFDRRGWVGWEYECPNEGSLVFAYRLDDASRTKTFHPRGLRDNLTYEAVNRLDGISLGVQPGRDWTQGGLTIRLEKCGTAALVQFKQVG